MVIGSITKTIVAAQVMQLVEAGELNLDDPATDHLPGGLRFRLDGATIGDLSGMRSGIPESTRSDTDCRPAGREFEYSSTNYALLGLILERTTGRPVAEVLRDGVLDSAGFERLVYQPDEHPTGPLAPPEAAPARTLKKGGGYLPSLAGVTAAGPAAAVRFMGADGLEPPTSRV